MPSQYHDKSYYFTGFLVMLAVGVMRKLMLETMQAYFEFRHTLIPLDSQRHINDL